MSMFVARRVQWYIDRWVCGGRRQGGFWRVSVSIITYNEAAEHDNARWWQAGGRSQIRAAIQSCSATSSLCHIIDSSHIYVVRRELSVYRILIIFSSKSTSSDNSWPYLHQLRYWPTVYHRGLQSDSFYEDIYVTLAWMASFANHSCYLTLDSHTHIWNRISIKKWPHILGFLIIGDSRKQRLQSLDASDFSIRLSYLLSGNAWTREVILWMRRFCLWSKEGGTKPSQWQAVNWRLELFAHLFAFHYAMSPWALSLALIVSSVCLHCLFWLPWEDYTITRVAVYLFPRNRWQIGRTIPYNVTSILFS